jgi:hypothetical protein
VTPSLRQKLGATLLDWPSYEWHLRGIRAPAGRRGHWTRIGNRRDRLRVGPEGRGVLCEGRWTTRLHGCDVFPALGRRLLERALVEWPIAFAERPRAARPTTPPDVSFVIGHRGLDRLPQLALVLSSIAAQAELAVECVLVEQSQRAEIADRIPDWVRYVHTPAPEGMPYSRSWAFNVGARAARGRLLAFHDGDMAVPARYAAELLAVRRRGYEVINLKRFVFYLAARETERALQGEPLGGAPERVVQNLEGGGSVAVDRDAFFALGGFDESFVGWGGEDNEFWERSAARTVWPWGYVPLVHLHHADQPEKGRRDRATIELLVERSRISPPERIRELAGRAFGGLAGPDPTYRAGRRR